MSERLHYPEQTSAFTGALCNSVVHSAGKVYGNTFKDPTTGEAYVKRVFLGVPLPEEVANYMAYSDGIDQRVPQRGDIATKFPLRGDRQTPPTLKIYWEFNPVTEQDGSPSNSPDAANRRGHVGNFWLEAPDGLSVVKATAFKPQLASAKLEVYATNDEKMAVLNEYHRVSALEAEAAALAEAQLLGSQALVQEVEAVTDFVNFLASKR